MEKQLTRARIVLRPKRYFGYRPAYNYAQLNMRNWSDHQLSPETPLLVTFAPAGQVYPS